MQGGLSPAPLEPGAQDGFPAWSGSLGIRFHGSGKGYCPSFLFLFLIYT